MCYQNDSITVKFNVSDQKYKLIKLTINGYDIEVNCSNFKDNSLRDFHKTYNDDTCELTLNYDRIKKILRYAYENNNIDTEDFYEMADEDISNGIEIKYAFASEYWMTVNKYWYSSECISDFDQVGNNGPGFVSCNQDLDLTLFLTDKDQFISELYINDVYFTKEEVSKIFNKTTTYNNLLSYGFNYDKVVNLLTDKKYYYSDSNASYLFNKYTTEKQIKECLLKFRYKIVSPNSLFDKRQSFFENFYKSNLSLSENTECQKILTYIRHVDSAEAERLEDIAILWEGEKNSPIRNFKMTDSYVSQHIAEAEKYCLVVLGKKLNIDGSLDQENIDTLDLAIENHNKFPGSFILVTGGHTCDDITKKDLSEGGQMKKYLVAHGVAESQIIVDSEAADTVENIKNTFAILNQANMPYSKVDKIFVLTRDYHMNRSYLVFYTWMRYFYDNYPDYRTINIEGCLSNKTNTPYENRAYIANGIYKAITGIWHSDWW